MRRYWLVNGVIAVVPGLFVVGITTALAQWQQHHPLDLLGYLWIAAVIVALGFRIRFPLLVFLVTAALTVSYFYWSPYPFGPLPVLPAIALITLSYLRGPLTAGIAGLAIVVVAQLIEWQLDGRPAGMLLLVVAGTAIGAAARARQERAAEHSQRIAEKERLHLAREVHDVVAHSLAMINVQAGVGAHIADKRPDQAKEALLAIKEASRVALADLRATLKIVRSDGRSPVPSLDRVQELLDAATAAGLTIKLDRQTTDLPAPVSFTAYRILQESLTNAVRHAQGADTVTIGITQQAHELELVITDNGSAPTANIGNGLRGMRERAEALGGTLEAGPADQGFRVRAVLPLRGEL